MNSTDGDSLAKGSYWTLCSVGDGFPSPAYYCELKWFHHLLRAGLACFRLLDGFFYGSINSDRFVMRPMTVWEAFIDSNRFGANKR